jgi:hypothetical protein
MKLTKGTLAVAMAMMTSGAWAQNPNIIDNVQSKMTAVQQQKTADSNAALGITGTPDPAQSDKPGAGSGAKSATAAATTTSKPVPVASTAKQHSAPAPRKMKVTHSVIAAQESVGGGAKKTDPFATKSAAGTKLSVDGKSVDGKSDAAKAPKAEEKKWAMSGKRDPFFSPVVQQPSGSGCSTGKKCLEIGQINLRGVVKSEAGFIAVVTNSMNKAYFLHENDPVFNGYVVKITGDSVVFQETGQDKLGKPLTHEVVKKIFTPAV